ncbi:N-acetyl-gamma-glutamyl-phosphate reductase [Chondromyces apiculatus]|uniref:N-acetyl-gamma-glutamyl-phosphate reductase n=1 Tax=Chondromyces apiculatus DSM 436 TaxID=1192034 RepID=A0A017SWK2_9BACT|nr:N-acetyl-gamma-glutamyl-phosphate reductase [Chondromyces apiculatus]EYF00691.1 N-acetyl-gamma-glutamyl-phosphate reductase [Chondromyces apiculatus DSM 436]
MAREGGAERIGVGLVGARGYTGAELVRLVEAHPRFHLTFAVSRQGKGRPLSELCAGAETELVVEALEPAEVAARGTEVVILALPNGQAAPYVAAIEAAGGRAVIVDLSADHRFDAEWRYGLPELRREALFGARRIANPGCYATGAQLGIAPALGVLGGMPHVFGVSGYSGAGTTPSDRNDPEKLRDNLMPYALVGHVHEREIGHGLGVEVAFVPHVAPFFRGITLTIAMPLATTVSADALRAMYQAAYEGEALVAVQEEIPLVRDAAGRHGVTIGGITVDAAQRRAVVVVTLDNLLKGAATQALQNMNLAFSLPELLGVPR